MNLLPQSLTSLDILSQLTDAVIAIDLQGRILFWNPGAVRLYGWTEAEALGQSAHELLNTRSAEPIEPLIDLLLREGRWEGELTRHSRSGDPIDVLSRWSLIRDPDGAPVARILIDSDLTETRLRFHQLRIAEERAREVAAEAANRESLIGCLLDGIPDCAYLKDPESRYIAVNTATASFFGRTREAIVGKTDAELFPPEKAREILAQDKQILASGQSISIEEELPGSSEAPYFHTVKTVCRDRSGQVIGIVGLSRDMRDRKKLEIALLQRERELTEANRIAGIGTWRWIRKTDTVLWSEETFRLFKLDPSQGAPGFERMLDLYAPASRKRITAAVERAVRLGKPYECDVELILDDRTSRWICARGEVESWEDGEVAVLRGTVSDITERKQAERELTLSENRYRSLVHASSQIVWSTNPEGSQMNRIPEWQAFTGQSDAEVLGYGWADAIHPDDLQATLADWVQATNTGTTYTLEHRLRRRDGVYRLMAVRAVPVHDSTGTIVEWVGTHTDITEQKAAETELRNAHERLQNVLDSITDGLAILDRNLCYTYYNKSGADALGLRPEDIIGKRVGDLFPQNRTNLVGEKYRHALETGEPCHFEVSYGPPLSLWIELHCYPSAQGLTVYYRDISERKQTEAALLASESRYRKLFESDLMGVGIPDRFGAFRESNNELLRIIGYTREELEAGLVRWDTMTPSEYATLDFQHIAEAAQRGACTPYEKEYIRKDGSRVPILCGYVLLEGSQDEYLGFVLDLSRQRAAEAELREREQRFRLLAESLPELVWVTDSVGSLTYLNSRFLDYCGIAPENMMGFDWFHILHPDEASHVVQRWTRTVETGQNYLIELRMRAKDGSFRHFLARALPMRNEAGEILRWVGSCTDIHDQKLAEEALRRSEKLAATGRLAASIAHEINNPLSSVTNSLYLALQDPQLSGETRAFLLMAEQELNRVTHITTQTLRFHRQSKAATRSDLTDTMASVLTLFGPRLMARKIEVFRDLEPGAHILCFDDELRQVFANLVSNSLDATAERGRIHIRVRKLPTGIRITVADTGCGIPEDARKRIFEPFFSTKDTTGIGLGLWVSDGILRKHQGRFHLRSSTHPTRHGTAISLFLPEGGIVQPVSPTEH